MNLDVTSRATRVLRILIVSWTSRLVCSNTMVHAVTRQTEVVYGTELQHSRIGRTMRDVTGNAPVRLHRRMFERKWTLLIGVTLDARGVGANGETSLSQLETAVRIVAIAASHGAFEHLVMGRHRELMFDFAVTAQTKLRFADLE